MALLFMEGWEQYTIADEQELARGGWYTGGTAFSDPNYKLQVGTRHTTPAGQEMQLDGTLNDLNHSLPPTTEFTVGMAYRQTQAFSGILFNMRDDLTSQLNVITISGGEIRIRRANVTLETTSGLGLADQTWHYIELKAKIDNSTGTYEIKVDGQTVMSDTGVDTQGSANNVVNRLEILGNSTQDTQYDDIYFLDVSGSDNTTFLGEVRIETVFPDALGNENDFTASPAVDQHLNVDDGVTPDDDTTYNHSATATDRELYGFAALQGNVGTVFAVNAIMLVRKEEAGFREVRVIARSNVTEVEGSNEALAIDYVYKNHIYENDPNGGIDWTETSVNAAQFGLDLQT